jgi:hyaluronan synthase
VDEITPALQPARQGGTDPRRPKREKDRKTDAWDWLLRGAILAGLAALLHSAFFASVIRPLVTAVETSELGRIVERPSLLWTAMGTLLLAVRTALWFRYRPALPVTMDEAPVLTVIIPAYNEGPMVANSIESVAAAAYPRERLEIFVVDDGSTDDTWEHIQRVAARHPGLVTTLRFPTNRGKRAGLAAGFRHARGEIVVTIDSDSVIEPGALLAIAGGLRDPKVAAVAGRVAVYNRSAGIIPRMLHVRFALSFDFMRAAQSTYGTVYCCPGALSAYRTSVVRQVLEAWENQTFLGAPCTYGEDRALTNAIFALGYDAVYQRNAVVHTVVPETYRQLCKMFLRWDRSYIREEILFARIVWRRPLRARVLALCETTITNLRYPVAYASLALLLSMVAQDGWVLARVGIAIGVMALFNMLYFLRMERSWAFLHGVVYAYFSFVALFWIFPYALVTVRSRSWMTR